MTQTSTKNRVERDARLRWVPLGKMRVSPHAQRELRQHRVDYLVANFNLEELGAMTVNERGGWFYIIDGQHRRAALIEWLGGDWESQKVQCWTYAGLSEREEADKFDRLNDNLNVAAYDKFKVRVAAGRPIETDVNRIVKSNGQAISKDRDKGIGAITALIKIYERAGADQLGKTIRIIDNAYGNSGFEVVTLNGIGFLCQRYDGQLDEPKIIQRLSTVRGGVKGLIGRAQIMREKTKQPLGQCLAAAAVEVYNTGSGGKKLPGWWSA